VVLHQRLSHAGADAHGKIEEPLIHELDDSRSHFPRLPFGSADHK